MANPIATPDPRLGAKGFVPIAQPMLAEVAGTKPGIKMTGKDDDYRSFECSRCHLWFKRAEMEFYQGSPFGKPCGCNKDIPQLMRRGQK